MSTIDLSTFQIEKGSKFTEYELPAPTPDYPVEIHSLNDFDVVSSTEKLSKGQLEDYNYDAEYENIDKINLSLSEPLRSVGDVKDRLFKDDSDGLWKVERNIEPTHPEDGTRTIEETYDVLDSPIYEVLPQELQDKLNNLRSFQDSNYVYTIVDKTDILPSHISKNLKPTIHTEFLAKDHFKESRTVNNLLIWSRALEDEESLSQNKLFHERFNMRSNTIKGEPIN